MIELKNISKTYQMGDTTVAALQNVSLKISAGEFIAIMGPSGSGKSTLMHVLGLLDRPDSGEYYFYNTRMDRLSEKQLATIRNRLVGFIFQQFHLLARMSALDNTSLPLIYAGESHLKDKARKRIIEVGLKDRMRHHPNELSGGQQQRVAIARSLVNDPPVIFADEPTGNLDSKSKEEIMAILLDLNKQGKTIIVVTHENEVAAKARRVINMRDGQVTSDTITAPQAAAAIGPSDDKAMIEGEFLIKSQRTQRRTKFFDYIHHALFSMVSHKMRSFLSILGILIGVAAVIAMLALGSGAQESIEQQLSSMGSNLLMVRQGSSRVQGIAMEAGTVTRLTFQDATAIDRLHNYVKDVNPSVSGRAQLVFSSRNWNTQVEGAGVEYASMRNAEPTIGRFFTQEEVRSRDKVAVVGATVVRELFQDTNPIGQTIKINLINFKVVGVLPEKGASSWRDQDDTIVVPITTAMYRLLGKDYLDSISVEVKDISMMDDAQDAISDTIIKQHHLGKNDQDSFQIRNMAEIKSALEATTKTMSLLLGAIAAISLLVGGIGIMNIMLVSVTERTREIGLRKAIGATNQDVMVQFLIEAMLMSLIGGVVGILSGCGIAVSITAVAGWAVKISPFSIALSTLFSLVIGVIFGLWPARQASKLDPIEALRYE